MIKHRFKIVIMGLIFMLCYVLTVAWGGRHYEVGTGSLEGTVLDKTTGLRWTKCSMKANGVMDDSPDCSGPAAEYTWEQAVAACHKLDYKGINTWRLPNIRELLSIVVYYQIIDPVFDTLGVSLIDTCYFPKIPRGSESGFLHSHYWSSTTYQNDPKRAWSFDFLWGASPGRWKTQTAFVRCVSGPEK